MALVECLTIDYISMYKMTVQKKDVKKTGTFRHCNIFHFLKALRKNGWKVVSCEHVTSRVIKKEMVQWKI